MLKEVSQRQQPVTALTGMLTDNHDWLLPAVLCNMAIDVLLYRLTERHMLPDCRCVLPFAILLECSRRV